KSESAKGIFQRNNNCLNARKKSSVIWQIKDMVPPVSIAAWINSWRLLNNEKPHNRPACTFGTGSCESHRSLLPVVLFWNTGGICGHCNCYYLSSGSGSQPHPDHRH